MAIRHYGCGSFNKYGFIDCNYWGEDATFNRQTLRFQMTNRHGYVASDEAADSIPMNPYISIGKCSAL